MAQGYDVYAIQRQLSPFEKPLYGRPAPQTTVVIPVPKLGSADPFKLASRSKDRLLNYSGEETLSERIFKASEEQRWVNGGGNSLELPPDIVELYDIREGDLLTLVSHSGLVHIDSINHKPPEERKERYLGDHDDLIPQPSTVPLPLGLYDSLEVRMVEALAPLGFGDLGWRIGLGGPKGGKSWVILEELAAALSLQKLIPKLFVLVSYTGDRPLDYPRYLQVNANAPDPTRVRAFAAPADAAPAHQMDTLRFAVNMAKLLCLLGYHVVWFGESWSKTTVNAPANPDSAFVPGGVSTDPLREVTGEMMGICGDYRYLGIGAGSITAIGSVMAGNERSREATVDRETSDNVTTSLVRFDENLQFPKINPDSLSTYTRHAKGFEFRTPVQIRYMQNLRLQLDRFNKVRYQQHLNLLETMNSALGHDLPYADEQREAVRVLR